MKSLAVILVAVGLALVAGIGSELLIDASEASGAAAGLPHRVGPVVIVWARVPPPDALLECFVARAPTSSRAGTWLCG